MLRDKFETLLASGLLLSMLLLVYFWGIVILVRWLF